jgi:hypothetical protein
VPDIMPSAEPGGFATSYCACSLVGDSFAFVYVVL